ncbi:MAG: PAS domain S-box protein [Desulfobacterota bacterium]|nr:PAS domain S-box protein [Thermodesulfobacteriota bacterium]
MTSATPISNIGQELIILKEAVENTNEAFVTINQEHQIVFFNQAAEKIFGYHRKEVLGKDLGIILTSRCSQDHRKAVERYLKTKTPVLIGHETEFLATRKNGELFPAAISFSVSEANGRLYFTALIRDLTETKKLQEQLLRSERLAALGQVVAEITHEIKNPLIIIGGFAQQLKKSFSEGKELTKLNIIVEEIKRLENLLMKLREIYLPQNLDLAPVDINELLKEVYLFLQEDCQKKKIRINLNTKKNGLFIEGDREKLKQVLINIIKNAIEAINEGGNILIRSICIDNQVEVEIADDGPGIPPGNQEKIFLPFFTTKKQGSGLGLPICKRIIEDHTNASLSLKSEEGKGTKVKIIFPLLKR